MRKVVATLLMVVMVWGIIGCGMVNDTASAGGSATSESQLSGENTMGNKLGELFLSKIGPGADKTAIAQLLADESGYDCVVVEAQEGYLNGFTEEIKGFKSAVQFAPMIGSIPFVGYIFETDDAAALRDKLTSVADPRWNICTEAAETICVVSGNYVFFTMCPGEE